MKKIRNLLLILCLVIIVSGCSLVNSAFPEPSPTPIPSQTPEPKDCHYYEEKRDELHGEAWRTFMIGAKYDWVEFGGMFDRNQKPDDDISLYDNNCELITPVTIVGLTEKEKKKIIETYSHLMGYGYLVDIDSDIFGIYLEIEAVDYTGY